MYFGRGRGVSVRLEKVTRSVSELKETNLQEQGRSLVYEELTSFIRNRFRDRGGTVRGTIHTRSQVIDSRFQFSVTDVDPNLNYCNLPTFLSTFRSREINRRRRTVRNTTFNGMDIMCWWEVLSVIMMGVEGLLLRFRVSLIL